MDITKHLKLLGHTFYMIDPFSTMYEKVSDLPKPDWMTQVSLLTNYLDEKYQNKILNDYINQSVDAILYWMYIFGTHRFEIARKKRHKTKRRINQHVSGYMDVFVTVS